MANVRQHPIGFSMFLHLFPGALVTLFYLLTGPLALRLGYPALAALLVGVIVLVVVELGWLLYEGRRRNGRLSLRGIVVYREPMPGWQLAVYVALLLVWGFLWFGLLAPLDTWLMDNVFGWLPDWMPAARLIAHAPQVTPTALWVTLGLLLVLNGVVGPVVEELYFRGYLLPRIDRLGAWAPLVNVVLFSLYHFFSPWQNLTRILSLLPIVYAVWWKKNIYVSLITHVLLNLISVVITMVTLLPVG